MEIEQVYNEVKGLNIDDESSLCFVSACIVFLGYFNNTVSVNRIKRGTGFLRRDVEFVVNNLWANGIIVEYRWAYEWTLFDIVTIDFIVELTLAAMAGAGIVRASDKDGNALSSEYKAQTWGNLYSEEYSHSYFKQTEPEQEIKKPRKKHKPFKNIQKPVQKPEASELTEYDLKKIENYYR